MTGFQPPALCVPRALRSKAGSVTLRPAGTRHRAVPMLSQVSVLDYANGLLIGAGGQVCCVWDARTGEIRERLVVPDEVRCVSLARDASQLAIGFGNIVRVYTLTNSAIRLEYVHNSAVHSVHIGKSGSHLTSADVDGRIQLRSLVDEALRAQIEHGSKPIVYVDPCDRVLVVETAQDVVFFDLGDGRKTRVFSHLEGPSLSDACSRDAQVLVAPSGNRVRLFDIARERQACFRVLQFAGAVRGIDISTGKVLVATDDLKIHVFDLYTGEAQSTQDVFTGPLLAARFGAGSDVFAAAGEALIMKLSAGQHEQSYCDLLSPVVSGALAPDRQSLLVSDRVGGLACFDLRSGDRHDRFAGHRGSVSTVCCDHRYVVSGAYDGICRVRRWDGSVVVTLDLKEGPIQALALESAGERLWVGAYSGAIACYELSTARRSCWVPGDGVAVRSLAYCADTKLLLCGAFDGRVVVRKSDSEATIVAHFASSGPVYRCVFDLGGSVLVASGSGVCRYVAASGELLRRYGDASIRGFCILDDGNLCTLGLWGELEVFDADTGARLHGRRLDSAYMHRFVLALGADRLVTGSANGEVRVFNYALEPIATLQHLHNGVLWTTLACGGHPGWAYTDRPELLDIEQVRDDHSIVATDAVQRQQHLAIYNSASHVMGRVLGHTPVEARDAVAELRARLATRAKLLSHKG